MGKLITGFILLFAFLWTTTGITVYSHYCSESRSVFRSLFVEDVGCEYPKDNKAVESCCSERKSCHKDAADSDCCATQKQVFKLALSFNIPGDFQKIKILDIKLFEHMLVWADEADDFENNDLPKLMKLPPGSYGKELLLAIHQQKIAPAPIV